MSEQPEVSITGCTFITKREPLGSQVWRWLRGDKSPAKVDHAALTITQANPPCECSKTLRHIARSLEAQATCLLEPRVKKLQSNMILSDADKEAILVSQIEARVYKMVAEKIKLTLLGQAVDGR